MPYRTGGNGSDLYEAGVDLEQPEIEIIRKDVLSKSYSAGMYRQFRLRSTEQEK